MIKKFLVSAIHLYKKFSIVFKEIGSPGFAYTECKFLPSCSEYAVESIKKHGAIKGSARSISRILRCSPISKGGIDFP